ncbi:hypothetical protein, partial [Escherichia coli]|uniref:hypothetical protein n=1 Tax=Escherichia coli TaxID=562 RepID=UPI0015518197
SKEKASDGSHEIESYNCSVDDGDDNFNVVNFTKLCSGLHRILQQQLPFLQWTASVPALLYQQLLPFLPRRRPF